MLILAIIVAGVAAGWIAQLLLGRDYRYIDWTMAFVAGIGGSFLGGLIGALLSGEGFALHPSGLIGSLIGAVIITYVWQRIRKNQQREARATASKKPWEQ